MPKVLRTVKTGPVFSRMASFSFSRLRWKVDGWVAEGDEGRRWSGTKKDGRTRLPKA